MKRTEHGNALAIFGNALREVLGLDPIYTVEGLLRSQPTEAERFYIPVFVLPQNTRKRAA